MAMLGALVYFRLPFHSEGLLSNENNFRYNKFLSEFPSLAVVGLGAEPFHFHDTHSDAFQSVQLTSRGERRLSTHGIEWWKIKDFLSIHMNKELRKNSNEKSKFQDGIWRMWDRISIQIYADILLNLFTAQRKFNFRNRYISSREQCVEGDVERRSEATAILKGELIVCFMYTK